MFGTRRLSARPLYGNFSATFYLLLFFLNSAGRCQQLPTGDAARSRAAAPVVITAAPGNTTENLNSLRAADSGLHLVAPLVGQTNVSSEFTREFLRVEWRPGDPIDLYIIRPRGVQNPPVVLYLYGYPSETDRFRNEEFCKIVTRDGFAAVGFVSALTGHRYHDRPMREWFVSELQEALVSTVHDVQMILNYLSTRSDLDLDRVGMFGQGSGGTIAILAAAQDPRIKAVDVLDPWGVWPEWMAHSKLIPEEERSTYLRPEFLKRVAPFDPLNWLGQLKPRPLRLQNALYEKDTPNVAKQRMETALPRGAQVVHYETPRAFSENAIADGKMVLWIKEKLRSVTSSGAPSKKAASEGTPTGLP